MADEQEKKHTDDERRIVAAYQENQYQRFLTRMGSSEIDKDEYEDLFYRYLYRLFLKMYELRFDGRTISKTQACRYIPLRHQAICQKYIQYAITRGYIEELRDEDDGRKTLLKPTPRLLQFVSEDLDRAADEIEELFSTWRRQRNSGRRTGKLDIEESVLDV